MTQLFKQILDLRYLYLRRRYFRSLSEDEQKGHFKNAYSVQTVTGKYIHSREELCGGKFLLSKATVVYLEKGTLNDLGGG